MVSLEEFRSSKGVGAQNRGDRTAGWQSGENGSQRTSIKRPKVFLAWNGTVQVSLTQNLVVQYILPRKGGEGVSHKDASVAETDQKSCGAHV